MIPASRAPGPLDAGRLPRLASVIMLTARAYYYFYFRTHTRAAGVGVRA